MLLMLLMKMFLSCFILLFIFVFNVVIQLHRLGNPPHAKILPKHRRQNAAEDEIPLDGHAIPAPPRDFGRELRGGRDDDFEYGFDEEGGIGGQALAVSSLEGEEDLFVGREGCGGLGGMVSSAWDGVAGVVVVIIGVVGVFECRFSSRGSTVPVSLMIVASCVKYRGRDSRGGIVMRVRRC